MLMMVGYDLHHSGDLKTLSGLLNKYGDAINLPNGPRFLDTAKTPSKVLKKLKKQLSSDDLLVASLGKTGAVRNTPTKCVEWLTAHGLKLNGKPIAPGRERQRRVLAIAYTVRIPESLHKRNLSTPLSQEMIEKREAAFLDANRRRSLVREAIRNANGARPVNALCFMDTDLSPTDVQAKLSKHLHKQDELFVVETDRGLAAKTQGWFKKHQVKAVADPVF